MGLVKLLALCGVPQPDIDGGGDGDCQQAAHDRDDGVGYPHSRLGLMASTCNTVEYGLLFRVVLYVLILNKERKKKKKRRRGGRANAQTIHIRHKYRTSLRSPPLPT